MECDYLYLCTYRGEVGPSACKPNCPYKRAFDKRLKTKWDNSREDET